MIIDFRHWALDSFSNVRSKNIWNSSFRCGMIFVLHSQFTNLQKKWCFW